MVEPNANDFLLNQDLAAAGIMIKKYELGQMVHFHVQEGNAPIDPPTIESIRMQRRNPPKTFFLFSV